MTVFMTSTRVFQPQYVKPGVIRSNLGGHAAGSAQKPTFRTFVANRPCSLNAVHTRRVSRAARGSVSQTTKAMDAAAPGPDGSAESYEVVYFPRVKERDCWRCLGVKQDATHEEILEARNYLVDYHKTHIEGVEAIERAFDEILSKTFKQRKKTGKINLSKKKETPTPAWQENFMSRFARPSNKIIRDRAIVYAGFIAWALYQSAQTGPAFQVLCSFALTVYFLVNKRGDRSKTLGAIGHTLLALVVSWTIGTVVPVYMPFLFPSSLSPESICSLFTFVAMFITATFLK